VPQGDLGGLRSNAVPGEGNPAARIMFVGEAPGPMKMHKADPLSEEPTVA